MKQVNTLSSEVAGILTKKKWTQRDLALRAGVSEKHISKVLSGDIRLSIELAVAFEFVLGKNASEWLDIARADEIERVKSSESDDRDLLDLFKPCYRELVQKEKIQKSNDPYRDLLKFFGVSSLGNVQHVEKIAFRGEKDEVDKPTLAAWLRVGELEAKEQDLIGTFNKGLVKEYIPKFRALTTKDDGGYVSSELKRLCNECGIHLVFTPYYKKTYINGAVRWLKDEPIIQLNDKLNYKDTFWFSFFHELAHLLLHSKKISEESLFRDKEQEHEEFFEFRKHQGLSPEAVMREQEADNFAQKALIPTKQYREIQKFLKSNPVEAVINYFSEEMNLDKGIIAGRLAYEQVIDYRQASSFRTKLKFSS